MIQQAQQFHQRGELWRAARIYRRALERDPASHAALHGLGLVMAQQGRVEEALHLVHCALQLRPGEPDYHYNLGETLRNAGRHAEAVGAYLRAIALASEEADYHFGLGNALADSGDETSALQAFRQAAALAPDDPRILNNLGNAEAAQGDPEAAVGYFTAALALDRDYGEAHYNLSAALLRLERVEEATRHCRLACRLLPSRPEPLKLLGDLLDACGNPAGAVESYRTGAVAARDAPVMLAAIAAALLRSGDPPGALGAYRRAIEHQPRRVDWRTGACHCLIHMHRFDDAERESQALLSEHPDCAPALGMLAVCLQARGRFDRSVELLQRALALRPEQTESAYALAASGGYRLSDAQIARWAAQEADPDLPDEKRYHLQFALGKARERRGDYAGAFEYFRRGNALKARLRPFDATRHETYVARIKSVFSGDFFAQRREYGLSDERLLFIVGMPRSGSTLVEQVLARHPDVGACGEHPEIREIVRELPGIIGTGKSMPECAVRLAPESCRSLGRRYLDSLPGGTLGRVRISDKLLGNFLRLGVIALLLPRARVIHCRRNPLDTCLSCYTQDFNQGLRFSTGLESVAAFYRSYHSLMQHWRSCLPLPVFDLDYESMVREPESTSRRMLEFCGLEWDERCLEPERVSRHVATASVWQARQPVYQDSAGRWRHYQEFLGPLIAGLGDLVDGQ